MRDTSEFDDDLTPDLLDDAEDEFVELRELVGELRRENEELRREAERLRHSQSVYEASARLNRLRARNAEVERDTAQAKVAWITDHLQWADATFQNATDASTLRHIELELDELCAAPDDLSEAADIGLILMFFVHRRGGDLLAEMAKKAAEIRGREFDPETGETAGKELKRTHREIAERKLGLMESAILRWRNFMRRVEWSRRAMFTVERELEDALDAAQDRA